MMSDNPPDIAREDRTTNHSAPADISAAQAPDAPEGVEKAANTPSDEAAGSVPGTSDAKVGTALGRPAPVVLDARLAAATAPGAEPVVEEAPRTLGSRLLDYSAHAAMIVGLIGFAWTVSNHVVTNPVPGASTQPLAAKAIDVNSPAAELADLRKSNERLSENVRQMQAKLDELNAAVRDDPAPAQLKILQAGLATVRGGLASVRSETGSAVTHLNDRLDKISRDLVSHDQGSHEQASHEQASHDRVSRAEPEHTEASAERAAKPDKVLASTDPTTGSLASAQPATVAARPALTQAVSPAKSQANSPAKSSAVSPASSSAKPAAGKLANGDDPRRQPEPSATDEAKPTIIAAYVVRDVYNGVALIEGRQGVLEVVPGVGIPGAGTVKAIERHGKTWTVITSKGQIAYAAPPREVRRSPREYYPNYRYDF